MTNADQTVETVKTAIDTADKALDLYQGTRSGYTLEYI